MLVVASSSFRRMLLVRSLPNARTYADGPLSGIPKFGDKEKAEENMYVWEKERAQYKKLKEELAKIKAALAKQEATVDKLGKKVTEDAPKAGSKKD